VLQAAETAITWFGNPEGQSPTGLAGGPARRRKEVNMGAERLRITFAGSFQCRLATDNDGTTDSPSDPGRSRGWTFAYGETKFDQIIRCAAPVDLRTALIDPYVPARVTKVEVKAPPPFSLAKPPWEPRLMDGLIGLPVSLGKAVRFSTSAGGGRVTLEALTGFRFSIGNELLAADAVKKPQLVGEQGSNPAWSNEYKEKKPGLVAAAKGTMDSARFNVLTTTMATIDAPRGVRFSDVYAFFFNKRCPTGSFPVRDPAVQFGAVRGVLSEFLFMLGVWSWAMELAFYRFDGDTLTGQLDGTLTGTLLDM
jgi:hypothetical protein